MERKHGKCNTCGQLSLLPGNGGLLRTTTGWACKVCSEEDFGACYICRRLTPKEKLSAKDLWPPEIWQKRIEAEAAEFDDEQEYKPQPVPKASVCGSCSPYAKHCVHCGKLIDWRPGKRTLSGGVVTCEACFKKYYLTCSRCEKPHLKSTFVPVYSRNRFFNPDGSPKTEDQVFPSAPRPRSDDPADFNHETRLCNNCQEQIHEEQSVRERLPGLKFYYCSECGEFYTADAFHPETRLCHGCQTYKRQCDECGGLFRNSEITILRDRAYCTRCLSRRSDIHSYSYTPRQLIFHKLEPQSKGRDPFLGIELEVDNPDREIRLEPVAAAVITAVGEDHVYLKNDGSLTNGFEQVTHPATLEYMLQERERYENLCRIPKEFKLLSHDAKTCGLHVHVGREFFGPDPRTQTPILARALWISERFWPELFRLSRRLGPDIRWAKRYLGPSAALQVKTMKKDEVWAAAEGQCDRYRALNLQKAPTLEFRIFRGTLNLVAFWATLQFVDNFVRLVKEYPDEKLPGLLWNDIIHYKDYPELLEYNLRRVGEVPLELHDRIVVPDITDESWVDRVLNLPVPGMPAIGRAIGATEVYLLRPGNPDEYNLLHSLRGTIQTAGGCWIFSTLEAAVACVANGLWAEDRLEFQGFNAEMALVCNSSHPRPRRLNQPIFVVNKSLISEARRAKLENPIVREAKILLAD